MDHFVPIIPMPGSAVVKPTPLVTLRGRRDSAPPSSLIGKGHQFFIAADGLANILGSFDAGRTSRHLNSCDYAPRLTGLATCISQPAFEQDSKVSHTSLDRGGVQLSGPFSEVLVTAV